jgi:hypothetical protein
LYSAVTGRVAEHLLNITAAARIRTSKNLPCSASFVKELAKFSDRERSI